MKKQKDVGNGVVSQLCFSHHFQYATDFMSHEKHRDTVTEKHAIALQICHVLCANQW